MNINGTHRSEAGSNGASDADWTALRYVLGEMSSEETDAFERILESDVQVCERVASAARLTADLHTAVAAEAETSPAAVARLYLPVRPAPASPSRPSRGGLWVVVGLVTVVCLLIAGGLTWRPQLGDDNSVADSADAGAGSLVAFWTEGSAEVAAETPASGVSADRANADESVAFADAGDDETDSDDDSMLAANDDYNVPGWMIAAVEKGNSWGPGTDVEIREN